MKIKFSEFQEYVCWLPKAVDVEKFFKTARAEQFVAITVIGVHGNEKFYSSHICSNRKVGAKVLNLIRNSVHMNEAAVNCDSLIEVIDNSFGGFVIIHVHDMSKEKSTTYMYQNGYLPF